MEWIVERLGKYHGTLKPGLNIVIPYLDKVAYQLVTKDIILDVQEQEVITRDNAVILTNAIAFVKVTDPVKAVYGVTDFSEAIRNLIMTTLRSIVGEMELDEALVLARQDQGAAAREHRRRGGRLGPDGQVGRDPGHQALAIDAEGDGTAGRRRARAQGRVTRAEGAKQAAILEAEARLESAKRDANAQVMLAEASAEAIRRVTAAIGDQTGPDVLPARREVHRRARAHGREGQCQGRRPAGGFAGSGKRAVRAAT
jgi:regulator of protease activity HflC (stomatin/prohibitin superfamily)